MSEGRFPCPKPFLFLAASVVVCGFWWGPDIDPVTRSRDAVQRAGTYAQAASDAAEMALTAAQNAIAMADEAEQALLAALRTRQDAAVKQALAALEQADAAAHAATEQTVRVVQHAALARRAADAAEAELDLAMDLESGRTAHRAARRAEDHRDTAQQAAARAVDLSEALKSKWLVASLSTASAGGTTPPGRR
jgi:hypothetical protein